MFNPGRRDCRNGWMISTSKCTLYRESMGTPQSAFGDDIMMLFPVPSFSSVEWGSVLFNVLQCFSSCFWTRPPPKNFLPFRKHSGVEIKFSIRTNLDCFQLSVMSQRFVCFWELKECLDLDIATDMKCSRQLVAQQSLSNTRQDELAVYH